MSIRRIIYILVLACAAGFYVLYPYWFSGYLLTVLLLLMPFDLLISLPGMLTRRVIITAPSLVEQGADETIIITTLQKKSFPARCIKVLLQISGDEYTVKKRIICSAQRGSKLKMPINSLHSGVITYKIRKIWTVSLFELFSAPVRVDRKASVLILPTPVKPPHIDALPRGVIFMPKPGGGFAEDYDLRQYHAGDMVRSIHWKASAKLDSLVIREPLIPPPHSRLIEVSLWIGADERDLILGRLRWVSNYLLDWEMPYYVRLGEAGVIAEITGAGDLTEYLFNVLTDNLQAIPVPASLPVRFAWVFRIDHREKKENEENVSEGTSYGKAGLM